MRRKLNRREFFNRGTAYAAGLLLTPLAGVPLAKKLEQEERE